MDVINGRLDLLDKKEELLKEQLIDVTNKKRKLSNNGNIVKEKIQKTESNKENNGEYFKRFNYLQKEKSVFLPTAMVRIQSGEEIHGPCKSLCDCGAIPNLISATLAFKFKSLMIPTTRKLVGIDGQPFVIRKKNDFKNTSMVRFGQCY